MKNIYCDGSSIGNPGLGGWAVYLVNDQSKFYGFGGDYCTNNQMEITAAINAVKLININEEANIYCDSQYVIRGITEWITSWKNNNWKTSKKENVLNKDLWLELDSLCKGKKVNWIWVKGHSNSIENNIVDQLAKEAALNKVSSSDINTLTLNNNDIKINQIIHFDNQDWLVFDCIDDVYLIFNGTTKSIYNNVLFTIKENLNTKLSLIKNLQSYDNSLAKKLLDLNVCKNHTIVRKNDTAYCSICNEYFNWFCEESPDNTCHYYSKNNQITLINKTTYTLKDYNNDYETDDCCIFCGQPNERK